MDAKQAKVFMIKNDDDEGGSNIFTRYFYYFESLLTSLREFKALKNLEFTRLSPILTYPTLVLDYKDQMIQKYSEAIEYAFHGVDSGPALKVNKLNELDDEKQQSQMNNYLIKNHPKFNKSQA